ncbi:hypothetical protein Mapa_005028 [Marchantia paleacea]|nr:hypothetical protein Mapa_005028 [Marchantia paleacea]
MASSPRDCSDSTLRRLGDDNTTGQVNGRDDNCPSADHRSCHCSLMLLVTKS